MDHADKFEMMNRFNSDILILSATSSIYQRNLGFIGDLRLL
ncbi:hypothetical protein [Natribacillus halophilus]|nr:hypothetical protein [Natribacillus halophilus]